MTIDSLEPSSGQLAVSDPILGLLGKLSFLGEAAMGVFGSCGVEAVANHLVTSLRWKASVRAEVAELCRCWAATRVHLCRSLTALWTWDWVS